MPFISNNAKLSKSTKLSSWRKTAIGTWAHPSDPSIYGYLELDVTAALEYIKEVSNKTGKKTTLTHFVGKVAAEVCRRHPIVNQLLRFGKLYSRTTIDIFYLVATDFDGNDLSGVIIRNADKKSLGEIAEELNQKVENIRRNGDLAFEGAKKLINRVPGIFSRFIMELLGFIMYKLNVWSPILGCPRDAFGSVMITSVGSLGLEAAFAPLVPYTHVPLMLTVGAAKDTPIVKDGQLAVSRVMKLGATIDHRLIDGVHASHVANTVRKIFAKPYEELGSI